MLLFVDGFVLTPLEMLLKLFLCSILYTKNRLQEISALYSWYPLVTEHRSGSKEEINSGYLLVFERNNLDKGLAAAK